MFRFIFLLTIGSLNTSTIFGPQRREKSVIFHQKFGLLILLRFSLSLSPNFLLTSLLTTSMPTLNLEDANPLDFIHNSRYIRTKWHSRTCSASSRPTCARPTSPAMTSVQPNWMPSGTRPFTRILIRWIISNDPTQTQNAKDIVDDSLAGQTPSKSSFLVLEHDTH